MKRLNFEHLLAEKSSMNKVDSFFVLILVLLSGLTVVYKVAQYDLGDVQLLASENAKLVKKIKILELKQKDLELSMSLGKASKRSPASVEDSGTSIELNPEKLAQGLYSEVTEQCMNLKKDLACFDKIDSLITQFPESKWAGKSLVVLTNIYIKQKRYEQAADLVKIVRGEFKNNSDVIYQLKEIEKSQL